MSLTEENKNHLFLKTVLRPTPPSERFEEFAVGRHVKQAKASIDGLIKKITANGLSDTAVIIGDNGNGKTLVNNWIKESLSHLNYSPKPDGGNKAQQKLKLEYFFTHVNPRSKLDIDQIGYDLIRQSQIHESIHTVYTQNIIADKVFRDFVKDYKPPYWVELLDFRKILKGAASAYDAQFGGAISQIVANPSTMSPEANELIDKLNKFVREFLANKDAAEKFRLYCRSKNLGDIYFKFHSEPADPTLARNNEVIFDAMKNARMLNSLKDSILALREMGALMNSKCLVLLIDDANDTELLKSLMGLSDDLAQLDREEGKPGILLVISMLRNTHSEIINTKDRDLFLKQRLSFKAPIELLGPELSDTEALVANLINLRTSAGLPTLGVDLVEIANQCHVASSYRDTMSKLFEKYTSIYHD